MPRPRLPGTGTRPSRRSTERPSQSPITVRRTFRSAKLIDADSHGPDAVLAHHDRCLASAHLLPSRPVRDPSDCQPDGPVANAPRPWSTWRHGASRSAGAGPNRVGSPERPRGERLMDRSICLLVPRLTWVLDGGTIIPPTTRISRGRRHLSWSWGESNPVGPVTSGCAEVAPVQLGGHFRPRGIRGHPVEFGPVVSRL